MGLSFRRISIPRLLRIQSMGERDSLSIFVKSLTMPLTEQQQRYSAQHEHVRKDVERAFGVLISRFGILERPLRKWCVHDICPILDCCVVLHNMTVEERKGEYIFNDLRGWDNGNDGNDEMSVESNTIFLPPEHAEVLEHGELLRRSVAHVAQTVEDIQKHDDLRTDLLSHIWNIYHQQN